MLADLDLGPSRSRAESSTPFRHVDWALMFMTALLAAAGIVALWSQQQALGKKPDVLLNKQGIALALGALGMFIIMSIDYRRLRDFAHVFYLGICAALVLVRFVGVAHGGAKAWFKFGPLELQPSELAKVTLVFMVATYASNDLGEKLTFDRFVRSLLIVGLPVAIVFKLQRDLGTASTMIAIAMGMLLMAKAPAKHIALITVMSIITIGSLVRSGYYDSYQKDRVTSFIVVNKNPDTCARSTQKESDNIQQVCYARQAVTLGRMTGAGFGKGFIAGSGLVAVQDSDFIFSAIAEQFGLIGAGGLLILYLLILLRCIRIAQIASDHTGSLVAVGAATLIAWHVFENVGMNIGIMPATGIPLPLVSYGGSSSIAFLALLGLVQNVHMRRYVRD
jgi:rod shape determining protein RodA